MRIILSEETWNGLKIPIRHYKKVHTGMEMCVLTENLLWLGMARGSLQMFTTSRSLLSFEI